MAKQVSSWCWVVSIWCVGEAIYLVVGIGLTAIFFPDAYGNLAIERHSGVTEFDRISTTIADSIEIILLALIGLHYKRYLLRVDPLFSTERNTTSIGEGTTTQVHPLLPLEDEAGASSQASSCCPNTISLWSALATPLRMGDTFYSSGVLSSFWSPLIVFALARLGALGIGLISGVPGGVPSLSVQLGQALYFAAVKRNLQAWAKSRPENKEIAGEQSYYLADVSRYFFCRCIQAYEDAKIVDGIQGKYFDGCCSYIVGPPVVAK